MKKLCLLVLFLPFYLISHIASAQDSIAEFGIVAGGFTNFPASKDYLKYKAAFFVGPSFKKGNHEISLSLALPLNTDAIFLHDSTANMRPGFVAGYKYYFADIYGREKFFVHYSFQYLRYKREYSALPVPKSTEAGWTETDMYINNVIGLGYNLYLDINNRYGFYYILDYVISQQSYKLDGPFFKGDTWASSFIWNNMSTQIGFYIRLF